MKHVVTVVGMVGRDEDGQINKAGLKFIFHDGLTVAETNAGNAMFGAASAIWSFLNGAYTTGVLNFRPLFVKGFAHLSQSAPQTYTFAATDSVPLDYIGIRHDPTKSFMTICRTGRWSKVRFSPAAWAGAGGSGATIQVAKVPYRAPGTSNAVWNAPSSVIINGV